MALAPILFALATVAPGPSTPAEKLVHRSIVEYNAGEFERALTDATQAYELDPRPAILYNLGQCHRALEHWKEALFFYRGFLREKPDAQNRTAVLALIEEMQGKLRATATPAATAPPLTPPPPATAPPAAPLTPVLVEAVPPEAITAEPDHASIPVATWWLGGSALVVGAVGTSLGIVAASTLGGDHPTTNAAGDTVHTIPASQYQAGRSEGLAADVVWGVGGALLITAIVVAVAR